MSVEPPQRLERRKFLIRLEANIEALEGHELKLSLLEKMDVRTQAMDLDKNSDRKPRFFLPSSPEFSPPGEDDVEDINDLHEVLADEDTCFTRPIYRARQVYTTWSPYASRCRPRKRDSTLWFAGDGIDPTTGAWNILDIRRPPGKYPHSKATVYNNWVGEEGEILRGELLAVLRLMLGRLNKRAFIDHAVAPVFILSFIGKHARAVESYYDGRYHLRITRLYNFPDETLPALKTLGEWFFGGPTGDSYLAGR
ncbi:hypothetical protein BDW62DRAFT_197230 [Aspergillus aurantiobrunneus]